MLLNDEIRNALNNKDLARSALRDLVYTKEVTTMLQDGLEKVLEGITTFEEIYKNVAIDNELDNKYGTVDYESELKTIKSQTIANNTTLNNQNNLNPTNQFINEMITETIEDIKDHQEIKPETNNNANTNTTNNTQENTSVDLI